MELFHPLSSTEKPNSYVLRYFRENFKLSLKKKVKKKIRLLIWLIMDEKNYHTMESIEFAVSPIDRVFRASFRVPDFDRINVETLAVGDLGEAITANGDLIPLIVFRVIALRQLTVQRHRVAPGCDDASSVADEVKKGAQVFDVSKFGGLRSVEFSPTR